MKKILLATDNLPNQINGVVTTFTNIKIQAEKNGYEFILLTPQDFKYFDMIGYPEVKMSIPVGLGNKIEDINPDYIHISTEGPIGFATRLYCDSRGYKYNTSYHTKFPEYIKKMYGIPMSITYSYVRWFHKHSGKVLATTKSMVDELKQNKFEVDTVIWSRGVDRELLRPTINRINNTTPVVLYVGRVSKEKGLDDLCMLQDYYDVRIVGDGPYKEHLQKKYNKVKFLGYKKGSELANEYLTADVFCFPSKTDTFGIVLIESMSMGTPIAAYPVSGPIDIVENGVNGYLGENLKECIDKAMSLDRAVVVNSSDCWTWENCWYIFEKNLVKKY